ncbi:MAG: hypothetical protein GX279_12275 [Clostridiaceae bacterium]|nr:hypothetical protein [Clostridiaceae bacterium]
MVEVYFYIPANKAGYAVECGLKLSEWYSRETVIDGSSRKCIAALLNPRDEYDKYTSGAYRCLKLEIDPKYCFAADRSLYEAGLSYPQVMELYKASIIPIGNYTFGEYRFPEVLVTSTILGENISVSGKMLDTPVLYENSQELYFNNLMEYLRDEQGDLNDTLLYLYFKWLCDNGKAETIGGFDGAYAVFRANGGQRVYTFRTPDPGGHDEI